MGHAESPPSSCDTSLCLLPHTTVHPSYDSLSDLGFFKTPPCPPSLCSSHPLHLHAFFPSIPKPTWDSALLSPTSTHLCSTSQQYHPSSLTQPVCGTLEPQAETKEE